MNSITTYFKDAVEELNHVRWPTRQQAVKLSAITIGFTLVASAVFGLIDYGLSEAIRLILNFTL